MNMNYMDVRTEPKPYKHHELLQLQSLILASHREPAAYLEVLLFPSSPVFYRLLMFALCVSDAVNQTPTHPLSFSDICPKYLFYCN